MVWCLKYDCTFVPLHQPEKRFSGIQRMGLSITIQLLFFLSVFKNSCVTDTPPLPLLLWPLILKSSWIPSREGKYSVHRPPELYVLLTLEQSLATKNRLPTPNFVDSSCATTVFWHSVLLSGSHELSLPLPRVTKAQHVTNVLRRNCNDQMLLKNWHVEKLFHMQNNREKNNTELQDCGN